MIPKDCKRLAEVDFPIAEVSRHSVLASDLQQILLELGLGETVRVQEDGRSSR